MQFVAALLCALFSYAAWWYIPRTWRKFRRDGHLRVSGRGMDVDFKHAWAVRCFLGFEALLGLVAAGAAIALVVTAFV